MTNGIPKLATGASPFVIITPAHNEESFIAKTIRSVIDQTIRPLRWVIVNDSSTDRTREVINQNVVGHGFIRVVDTKRTEGRTFSNKVSAFNHGLSQLSDISFDLIGNLDADISLPPDYFEKILKQFERDPKLGIAGGIVFTKIGDNFVTDDETLDSVAGAVQLFRRACFDRIGGYVPMPLGGIDAAAEIKARMKGWKVRKFPQHRVNEYRRTGSASARPLAVRIQEGRRFHSLGYGPLFYLLRCLYRLSDRPVILGSAAALVGYFTSMIRRRPVALSREVVAYLRAEQRQKLKRFLKLSPAVICS